MLYSNFWSWVLICFVKSVRCNFAQMKWRIWMNEWMSALMLTVQAALCAHVGWAKQRQYPTALTESAWLWHLNIPQPSSISSVQCFWSGSTAFFLLWGIKLLLYLILKKAPVAKFWWKHILPDTKHQPKPSVSLFPHFHHACISASARQGAAAC